LDLLSETIPPAPYQGKGEKSAFYVDFCAKGSHKNPQAGHATQYDFLSLHGKIQDDFLRQDRAG